MKQTETSEVDAELYETLSRAIRSSVALAEDSRAKLAGLALCTDDCLETLYCAVTTVGEVARSGPDFLYSPTDWPTEWESADLRQASALLRRRAKLCHCRAHVESAFELLVQVLSELRAGGALRPDCYLSVLSTDPSEHLETLERGSVERLNSPDIIDGRREFLARWS